MSNIAKISYIILALAIGYAFAWPAFGEVQALLGQKQKYEDALAMAANVETKKDELLTQYNAISETDRQNINTILPDKMDFVRLISQIDAVASRHGISISEITSRDNNVSTGNSMDSATPAKDYQAAIIGFSFSTSYEKFNAFLDDLEKSLRILDIKSVKLTAGEAGVYKFETQFEVYWLK